LVAPSARHRAGPLLPRDELLILMELSIEPIATKLGLLAPAA
jgi:hypothetical protein